MESLLIKGSTTSLVFSLKDYIMFILKVGLYATPGDDEVQDFSKLE